MVVDATGLRVYGCSGEWHVRKHRHGRRRAWRKLHLGVDERTKEIVAVEVTPSRVHDCRLLPALLDQIPGRIVQVSGDGAYDTRACYQSILEREAVATIPPRRSARLSESVDPPAWRAMRDAHLRRQRGEYGIGFEIYRQTDDGHRGGDFERSGKAGETKQGPHTVRIMAPDNSRSVAGATVYVYTFLLATPYKDRGPHEYQ